MSDKIKQDINFLEYPLWMQNERAAGQSVDGYIWKDRNGYTYRAGYKPPAKVDIIFLYYLLLKSQQENWAEEVVLTRYRMLKDCGIVPGKRWFDRLEDSLQRWLMVKIEFRGKFYDGREYQTLNFGIIDSWSLEKKTSKLRVRFSPEWQRKIRESDYFKMLDFPTLRALKSPLVIRLYEILIKNFQGRTTWEVDALKLARKIPMKEAYPADIIPKVVEAVRSINERSSITVVVTARRPKRGEAIFTFKKAAKEEGPSSTHGSGDTLSGLIHLLPEKHRAKKTILDLVAQSFSQKGYAYTVRNIEYTNRCCSNNYRAYLAQSLRHDWGMTILEDEQAEQKIAQARAKQAQEEELAWAEKKDRFLALPLDKQEELKQQAIANMTQRAREQMHRLSSRVREAVVLGQALAIRAQDQSIRS